MLDEGRGWSHDKRRAVEEAFYQFLDHCYIDSRDTGHTCLGANLFSGQKRFYTAVFDGLEEDKHDFFALKSRQLGFSTATRALSVFWLGLHAGLRGALVFDTAPHKEEARAELVAMLEALPDTLRFPRVLGTGRGNRDNLALANGSRIQFLSAGVRKSKSSGTLGRSSGLTLSHASELCSWDNEEGLKAYKQSLSEIHPNRLYIWESTARGYTMWYDMWKEARLDDLHCVTVFAGWWSKDSQAIPCNHPDFAIYGTIPPSPKEAERIKKVRDFYGVEITPEQLAWIRRKMSPTALVAGDADPSYDSEDDATMLAEQAWCEDEAFQQTGSVFFGGEKLTELTNTTVSRHYQTFMYLAGEEFIDMRVAKAPNAKSVELKVWEEPQPEGYYVLGVDPAFGHNENNDRSSIEVLRCYADGVDQVAEYAWPLINTRQFAWVIASLLGWYGSPANSTVKYALELNGPGGAVFNELRSLKNQIDSGYQQREYDERGLRNIFQNVRTYVYTRADAMGAGYNFHIRTNQQLKIQYMERLRDFVSNGMFRIRSIDLIEEMKTIARDGDSISAPSSMRDDRVMSAAFAIHCWESGPRRQLIAGKRTRAAEEARQRLTIVDQAALYNQNLLDTFFSKKRIVRNQEQAILNRQRWRYR